MEITGIMSLKLKELKYTPTGKAMMVGTASVGWKQGDGGEYVNRYFLFKAVGTSEDPDWPEKLPLDPESWLGGVLVKGALWDVVKSNQEGKSDLEILTVFRPAQLLVKDGERWVVWTTGEAPSHSRAKQAAPLNKAAKPAPGAAARPAAKGAAAAVVDIDEGLEDFPPEEDLPF